MTRQEEPPEEEMETYALVSTALRHPIRRRVLRMLAREPMSFAKIQNALNLSSAHLSYHLNALGELINQTEDGRYCLSAFGDATLSLMHRVEENEEIRPKKRGYDARNLWFTLFVIASFLIGAYLTTATNVESYTIYPFVTYTLEEGNFAGMRYKIKVEVITEWIDLSSWRGCTVDFHWISTEKNYYPPGDYIPSITYRKEVESNLYRTMEEVLFRYSSEPPISDAIHESDLLLPKAFNDEYRFKLTFYTNSTVQTEVLPARLILNLKHIWADPRIRNFGYGLIILASFLLIAKVTYPKTKILFIKIRMKTEQATRKEKEFLVLFIILLTVGSLCIAPIINQYLNHYLDPPSFSYSSRRVNSTGDREVYMPLNKSQGPRGTVRITQPSVFKARTAAPIEYKDKLDQVSITFTILLLTDWESTEKIVAYNETHTLAEWCENPPMAKITPEGRFTFRMDTFTTDNRAGVTIPYMVEWGFADWTWGLLPHETTDGRIQLATSITLSAFGLIGLIRTIRRISPKKE